MDRIGWTDDALIGRAAFYASMDEKASQTAKSTQEALALEESYQQSLKVLKQVGASSVATILFMEHYYLANEYEQARDPIQLSSLTKAIEQVQAARDMLSLTDHPDEYKKMVAMLPPQDKEKDLPHDSVRHFFLSHGARLHDRIKHGHALSEGQQEILKQRFENIKQARQIYMEAQREILGDDWKPAVDYSVPTLPSEQHRTVERANPVAEGQPEKRSSRPRKRKRDNDLERQ